MADLPTSPVEKDPNGVVAAVTAVLGALVVVLHLTVDDTTVTAIAGGADALITFGLILYARVKAWAPNSVRKLQPSDVPAGPELPPVPA